MVSSEDYDGIKFVAVFVSLQTKSHKIYFLCRCFAEEIDLSGLQIDVALRVFQTYFRMPVSWSPLFSKILHQFCTAQNTRIHIYQPR